MEGMRLGKFNEKKPVTVDPTSLDPPAFKALLGRFYEQNRRQLERWLRTRVSPQEAPDVLQDSIERLLGGPPPGIAITNFQSFVLGALNFGVKDWLRQRRRRQRLDEKLARFALEGAAQLAPSAEVCASIAHDLEAELERQLKALRRNQASQALQAFKLVKLDGLTQERAARQMGSDRRQVSRGVIRVLRILESVNKLGDTL
jgi:DNA-directed RNA polymerase specialized sigma24 family protein